jgi:hypothetical protein
MATYLQLYSLADQGGDLYQRIATACVIQANLIRSETPPPNSAQRLAWARRALADPKSVAQQMLWAALAQNAGSTTAQITGATDATLQTAVANAVDLLAGP